MSEAIIPDVEMTSDVPERKSLAEIVKTFEEILQNEDRMKMNKEVEALKSAFYKTLAKEKSEATVDEGGFAAVEAAFKDKYNQYKQERGEYNKSREQEMEANLQAKLAVIEELKLLIDKQENLNDIFQEFRTLQERWRAIGPVPAQHYRNTHETYQLYVEQFYDMAKINMELRDRDFKKNLELKEELCAKAELLAESDNVVDAFKELQQLHEQWKEYGPVSKELREALWERFKTATSTINKKYQTFFEELKAQQEENLAKKAAICEKAEALSETEVADLNKWNALSKDIEELQQEWKTVGFAAKKDNQKIYDRFRAACDKFYGRKREFYLEYKGNMTSNLEKKVALCEEAEQLKTSTEWKKTTDRFIALQEQWKEIGAVPRKKSDLLWKRFRAACDEFFAERDKNAKPENDFYGNLKAKNRLIDEIKAYELKGDASDSAAMADFQKRWNEIGFVPFKEKDNVAKAYKQALSKFPSPSRPSRRNARPQLSEKEKLIQKYHALEQDVATYENNIGFFSMSKNSEPLIKQMQERIDAAKKELSALAEQIKNIENAKEQE